MADVRPSDWAYRALNNLVERYGCVAGYANGTVAGGRPISRYEGAALLLGGWRGHYHLFAPRQRRHGSLALSRHESCASRA